MKTTQWPLKQIDLSCQVLPPHALAHQPFHHCLELPLSSLPHLSTLTSWNQSYTHSCVVSTYTSHYTKTPLCSLSRLTEPGWFKFYYKNKPMWLWNDYEHVSSIMLYGLFTSLKGCSTIERFPVKSSLTAKLWWWERVNSMTSTNTCSHLLSTSAFSSQRSLSLINITYNKQTYCQKMEAALTFLTWSSLSSVK